MEFLTGFLICLGLGGTIGGFIGGYLLATHMHSIANAAEQKAVTTVVALTGAPAAASTIVPPAPQRV